MTKRKLGVGIFLLGTFFMFMHTTIPFLWAVIGITYPYPLSSNEGFVLFLQGFSPAIGAILLVVGGLIYSEGKEITKDEFS
ncbi:MAG: hypothetical protein MUO54_08825 [Anaerolineales bacterium]|nr:hypothetical protein [Anaerolineales bacterium]